MWSYKVSSLMLDSVTLIMFNYLQGRTGSKVPIRCASASAVAKTSSGGLLSWLTGGSRSATPLEFPLAGVDLPPSLPDRVEPATTQVTILANGIKIASETSPVCCSFLSLVLCML